ncbi:MAG: hypothetical protein A2Z77_01685 [Chloroflexi bacterium RBG_13_51_36]|nr:MAG: hypothetical protein A2Z77_01685 [Chloroflexi bacterium RBG_13_51_36]
MDMVEDSGGEGGGLAFEEALRLGLLWAWEEEDCLDAVISLVEMQECLYHRLILPMAALGLCLIMEKWIILQLCHMDMPERLWEWIPMLRR